MNRAEKIDRAKEDAWQSYVIAYDRIEAEIIAENIADGADASYKPRGDDVHARVLEEFKRKKAENG